MRILLIHNLYRSGGIEGEFVVYQNEYESLRRKLGAGNVFSYEVSNDNISKVKLIPEIWFSKKHYDNIKTVIIDNKIDIVHVYNFFPQITPSCFKAARDAGAKVILTLHNYRIWCIAGILYRNGCGICEKCVRSKLPLAGIINKCYRKSILQSILAQLAFSYYKLTNAFGKIDLFITLTNFQKNKVISFGVPENKIILKPNGMMLQINSSNKKEGYIFVGRLEESKGLFALLDVWETLNEKFVLTIIGDGDSIDSLRSRYSRDNIIFKGTCSREETLNSISKSKFLIQPSLWYETFGLTIIEAMSLGVPVIGFDIGTRTDFIEDGYNGFLANVSSLKCVVAKSYSYLDYERMSKNAAKTAQRFDNELVIGQQIRIYDKVLKS